MFNKIFYDNLDLYFYYYEFMFEIKLYSLLKHQPTKMARIV
jgi:hypothetical protein